jgi:hypothetical protein
MKKFSNFIPRFAKIARFATYYFFVINLCIDLFIQDHLLNFNLGWWITYFVLDIWYHNVVIKSELTPCSDTCKSCQKLNS